MKILAHKDLGKKHAIIVVILLDNDLIFTGSLRRNSENIEIAVKKENWTFIPPLTYRMCMLSLLPPLALNSLKKI